MTTWLVITLILNLVIVAAYLIVQLLLGKNARKSCFLKAGVMLLCPAIGPACFFVAYLVWLFSRKSADLEDVIFSKERVTTYKVPEENKEMNVVSMADALVVSDRENLRNLMMNVVCDDDGEALAVIRQGLQSDDSETSHYAASVLQDKLGAYRRRVQADFLQLLEVEDKEARATQAAKLLEYMIPMLKRGVFGVAELSGFVKKADTLAEIIAASKETWIDVYTFDDLFHIAMEAKEEAIAEKWCNCLTAAYPDTPNAYSCRLHLYYQQGRREEFKETMEELKQSNVVVDSQLLEWIRTFR
jgi:hypothetical protein